MFNATDFTYDGVFSGTYGLKIATLNDDGSVTETRAFSPVLNMMKPAASNRFLHKGISYNDIPQFQFSVISETEIPDIFKREILSWLVGRKEFKELKIHQADLEPYSYRCVFTDTDAIYINGRLHGFNLTANFDSPYAYGIPTKKTITATPEGHDVTIMNHSDIVDGYVYPIVRFTGGSVEITNLTDDANRKFAFSNEYLSISETITVDNEMKIIRSDAPGEKVSAFTEKNWLRLRKGANRLHIKGNGQVTIICPCYAMIGF